MQRPPAAKPSCGARGSTAVYNGLMEALGAHESSGTRPASPRRAASAPASDGPIVVCYPEGVWYAGVTAADVPEIVEKHLLGGEPVERPPVPLPSD
jgi:(2Fe-2S) ferredoxin